MSKPSGRNGPAEAHVRLGWLRSVASAYHTFAVQSFVDELAHAPAGILWSTSWSCSGLLGPQSQHSQLPIATRLSPGYRTFAQGYRNGGGKSRMG